MRTLPVIFGKAALNDLHEIWDLVVRNDGEQRAESLTAKIETFCCRIGAMPGIGTPQGDRREGLRSVGVVGLRKASVVFRVSDREVSIIRVSYLGRNVWAAIETDEQR